MLINDSPFSLAQLIECRKKYLERLRFYKTLGFDQELERDIISSYIDFFPLSILEIGTGKGHLTMHLAKRFGKVVTVDIDQEAQKIAMMNAFFEDLSDKISFYVADASKIEYPDNSFDLVISSFSFHHMEHPESVLMEMSRLSSNLILISDFNANGLKIIQKAHALENRIHEEKQSDLEPLFSHLNGPCWSFSCYDTTNQNIYIWKKI